MFLVADGGIALAEAAEREGHDMNVAVATLALALVFVGHLINMPVAPDLRH